MEGTYTFVADQKWDQKANPPAWHSITDPKTTTVTIQANKITLQDGAQTYKGQHTQSSVPGTQEFELSEGLFAGGQFLIFTDGSAEFTVFGSGVPVISKHRGPLTKV